MKPDTGGDARLLQRIICHKQGHPAGILSVCSAHPTVLEAYFLQASQSSLPVLIESTCNQVNQDGGYTGQTPAQFAASVTSLAEKCGLPRERLVLGGDHLGPYPWKDLPPEMALAKACRLVEAYVKAGYTKIHLDASMPCAGEGKQSRLEPELAAQRTALLCQAAEAAHLQAPDKSPAPLYVIGTEVPSPGGIQGTETGIEQGPKVTQTDEALETIELTRRAFLQHNLGEAWERVIALVVQPGVEFGDQVVYPYQPEAASGLSRLIDGFDRLVYEAHSTDYQSPATLKQLVRDHFAILKVGPALTFAFREAVFALSWMEQELYQNQNGIELSKLPEVLVQAMQSQPVFWKNFFHGDLQSAGFFLRYSYSDRCRYYWSLPPVQAALRQLFQNLGSASIPPALISQFMPLQYQRICDQHLVASPTALVHDRIAGVLDVYLDACQSQDLP